MVKFPSRRNKVAVEQDTFHDLNIPSPRGVRRIKKSKETTAEYGDLITGSRLLSPRSRIVDVQDIAALKQKQHEKRFNQQNNMLSSRNALQRFYKPQTAGKVSPQTKSNLFPRRDIETAIQDSLGSSESPRIPRKRFASWTGQSKSQSKSILNKDDSGFFESGSSKPNSSSPRRTVSNLDSLTLNADHTIILPATNECTASPKSARSILSDRCLSAANSVELIELEHDNDRASPGLPLSPISSRNEVTNDSTGLPEVDINSHINLEFQKKNVKVKEKIPLGVAEPWNKLTGEKHSGSREEHLSLASNYGDSDVETEKKLPVHKQKSYRNDFEGNEHSEDHCNYEYSHILESDDEQELFSPPETPGTPNSGKQRQKGLFKLAASGIKGFKNSELWRRLRGEAEPRKLSPESALRVRFLSWFL